MVKIGNFNPDEHEDPQSPDPLPQGWYGMVITDTQTVKTKDGTGTYLQIEHTIIESLHPQHVGRKVWNNLNLWNSSAQAVAIAQSHLKKLAQSVGVPGSFDDTAVLHDKPIAVKVAYVPPRGEYDEKNEVKGYDQIGRVTAGAAVPQASGIPTSPQAHAAPAPAPAAPAPQATPQAAPTPSPEVSGGAPPWNQGQA